MKIKKITEIAPEPSRCIEVDSPDKLFAAGGEDGATIISHNSVVQRNIILGTIMRPQSWRFLGIDLKKVELSSFRAYSNVVLGIATTIDDALTILRFAQQTMMKRYAEMEQLGVNNFLDLPEKGQALLVMVDEAGELLSPSGVKALSENTLLPVPTPEFFEKGLKKDSDNVFKNVNKKNNGVEEKDSDTTNSNVETDLDSLKKDLDNINDKINEIEEKVNTPLSDDSYNIIRKELKNIQVGDKVFDNFGNVCTVTRKYEPVSQLRYDLTISSDSSKESENVVAGSEHNWVAYFSYPDGTVEGPKVLDTEYLFLFKEEQDKLPVDERVKVKFKRG